MLSEILAAALARVVCAAVAIRRALPADFHQARAARCQ